MLEYKTVEETAIAWNITPRHVQYLCRSGKIEGAIKRAGSWFIPENTPLPIKNTKANAREFQFVGTKSKIFDSAIELFMLRGFNDISLRDIADRVGIRQSTIYNHFKSKQEILDTIYDFYCHFFLKNRPSMEDMESLLHSEDIISIIQSIRYDFGEVYQQKMSDIVKIIFQRIAIDERAREICKSLMIDDGVKYVEDVFNIAIKNGRLAKFDTHAMSVFINSVRMFTMYNWMVDPSIDNMTKIGEVEHALYQYAAGFVTDLMPPAQTG